MVTSYGTTVLRGETKRDGKQGGIARERERMEPWRELALQKHKQKLKIEKVQERETREYGYDMHTDTVILRTHMIQVHAFRYALWGSLGPMQEHACSMHVFTFFPALLSF